MAAPTLADLRRYAVARTLFAPTTLPRAIDKLGFVQADPIRAPARAQDLTLRHRVKDYRAGDLEKRYAKLGIEEDFFVNYGFLPRATHALMHPRAPLNKWTKASNEKAAAILDYVRANGVVHPRDVDAHFQHGRVTNWFGGTSNASTHLLDGMHYRGLLRVAGRESGTRLYAAREATPPPEDVDAAMDALIDVIVHKYAPLPLRSLGELVYHLRRGAPQWNGARAASLRRAKDRLASAEVDGLLWLWPQGEKPQSSRWAAGSSEHAEARFLAPFDPVVWDRRRFEVFWGWAYRFEAYTPAAKRLRGHYALPLLWRDQVVGWGNLSVVDNQLRAEIGYAAGKPPREKGYKAALEEELRRISTFLGLD